MVINYHMKFHKDWRTEKYRKLFGDTLYNILVDFAENDKKEGYLDILIRYGSLVQTERAQAMNSLFSKNIRKRSSFLRLSQMQMHS